MGYLSSTILQLLRNYAQNNPMAQLFDSVSLSIIDNTTVNDNQALNQQQILSEFNTECQLLCFLPTVYKEHLLTNELITVDNAAELDPVNICCTRD